MNSWHAFCTSKYVGLNDYFIEFKVVLYCNRYFSNTKIEQILIDNESLLMTKFI